MTKEIELSNLRHEIDNSLLALEVLFEELRLDMLNKSAQKKVADAEEYLEKLNKNWDEYKKITTEKKNSIKTTTYHT